MCKKISTNSLTIKMTPEKRRLYLLFAGFLIGAAALLITRNLLVFAILAGGPYFAERYMDNRQLKIREKSFRKSLLAAIEILWIPCGAGLSFREAVKRISHKTDNPIIHELNRCYEEISAGKSRESAYRDVVRRSIPEVEHLIRAVSYNENMGEPISAFLRREAERLHMEKRAKIQEVGDKISSRIMFVVMGMMGPAFIVIIFGPIIRRIDWLSTFQGF